MKHLYKLLLVFLLPLFTTAQSNYKPGYVVTLKGDTLHGFIDFQEWDSNPMGISFKSAVSDSKQQKLTIRDISLFNVNGLATYQKFTCLISMDETNTAHLDEGRDTSYRTDVVFLKILQKGKNVVLYSYTDGLKARFYIGEAPAYVPSELVYRIYDDTGDLANKAGNTVFENTFLKQLFALANKYNVLDENLSKAFETSEYSRTDLLNIVSKINGISKGEYAKKYAEHSKLNFYVSAAVNIAGINSNPSAIYTIDGGPESYASYSPAISFGINIIPNPNTGKIELRAEMSIAEAQYRSSYQLNVSPYVPVKATFDQLGISIIPQVIYNVYNAENLKFYLGAGVGYGHFTYSNSYFGSRNPGTPDSDIGGSNPYYFNENDSFYVLKAGVKINKKLEIFADYFTNTAITKGGYFQLVNNAKRIGFVYFLGK